MPLTISGALGYAERGKRQTISFKLTGCEAVNTVSPVLTASHPVSLKEMVWRLPRTAYPNAPLIVSGKAVVDGSDPQFWQVKAGVGTQLVFRA